MAIEEKFADYFQLTESFWYRNKKKKSLILKFFISQALLLSLVCLLFFLLPMEVTTLFVELMQSTNWWKLLSKDAPQIVMCYILEQNDKALYWKQTKLPFSLPQSFVLVYRVLHSIHRCRANAAGDREQQGCKVPGKQRYLCKVGLLVTN